MEFLEYNTERRQLIIPEYGRHIHKMINQVNEIESRDERNKMTKAIIGVMGNLNPHLRDVPDFQHKLWDQLFIMSEFKLDVDSPFDKPEEEVLNARPECFARATTRTQQSATSARLVSIRILRVRLPASLACPENISKTRNRHGAWTAA